MSDRVGNWAMTYPSGVKFYPLDPRPEEIFIEDIAHHLSLICRYSGACPFHYSVAQHSLYVSALMEKKFGPAVGLCGLMHDAAEAYIGDMIRPIKRLQCFTIFTEIEHNLLHVIFEKFKIAMYDYSIYDDIILQTEKRDLGLPPNPADGFKNVIPLDETIVVPAHPPSVEQLFINKFYALNVKLCS